MRNAAVCTALVLLAFTLCLGQPLQAAEPAATADLPLALKALGADQTEILNVQEANQVRGQWWIFIPRTAGDISYQGVGSAAPIYLNLQSESFPPAMVGLRIIVGR